MNFTVKQRLLKSDSYTTDPNAIKALRLRIVSEKTAHGLANELVRKFPPTLLPEIDPAIEEYELSVEVFSFVEWAGFAQAFMASNPPYELKALFKSLVRNIGSVPEPTQAAEQPNMAQELKAQTIAALSEGSHLPSPTALTEAGLDPKMHGQVAYEDPWWETCYKVFNVLYTFTDPWQVRVWAVSSKEEDTPKGSFKGQFYCNDARVQRASTKLPNTSINNSMWSPVTDGGWNSSDTQPLVTSL